VARRSTSRRAAPHHEGHSARKDRRSSRGKSPMRRPRFTESRSGRNPFDGVLGDEEQRPRRWKGGCCRSSPCAGWKHIHNLD
jgi:hypothetical protein